MPATSSMDVDTVEVPLVLPLRRAQTVPSDGGLYAKPDPGICSPANGRPYDYPAPVYVRNTFVALVPSRDPSLDEFYQERRSHSCPANWGPSKCRTNEEEPLASSRTTASGSASEDSAAASTLPLELSDTEDMSELPPRLRWSEEPIVLPPRAASNARAAALPASCTSFRKTVSEYNGQPHNSQQVPAAASCPSSFDMQQERPALPPGPVHGSLHAPIDETDSCPLQDSYLAAYPGYNYNNAYGNAYDGGFAAGLAAGFAAGCHPVISSYAPMSGFVAGPGQEDMHFHSHVQLAPQQPGMQLPAGASMMPPPPGSPVSLPSPLPPPPAPDAAPSEESLLAPTRGSLGHGLGRCKPCAFFYTKGCGNGFECPFCHLCEAGEKKRRRKDKLEARRVSRETRQGLPFGLSLPMGMGRGLVF